MVLGDGYLKKTGKRNARLILEHKEDHKKYLMWKASLLPQLFQGKPKMMERIHPVTLKKYRYVRHQSNSSPILGKLRRIFYPDGKKHIPENLPNLMKDDVAFAIWYYDDGHYSQESHTTYLYLGKVTRKEAEIAQKTLLENFDLKSNIVDKKDKGFALYFPSSEKEKIKKILQKYYIPIMAYKIPS